MTTSRHIVSKELSAGDAAVEGLWQGLAAGIIMAVVLVAGGMLGGASPAMTPARFGASGEVTPAAGALTHLATAGVYGIVWGLLWRLLGRRLPLPVWASGLIYGLLLFLIAQGMLRAVDSPLRDISPLGLFLAHIVYGFVLGLMTRRSRLKVEG